MTDVIQTVGGRHAQPTRSTTASRARGVQRQDSPSLVPGPHEAPRDEPDTAGASRPGAGAAIALRALADAQRALADAIDAVAESLATTTEPDPWLGLDQLRAQYGITRESLGAATNRGELSPKRGPKGRVMVRRSDVEAWIESRPWTPSSRQAAPADDLDGWDARASEVLS